MPLGLGRGSGVAVLEMHGVIGTQVRVPIYARLLDDIAKTNGTGRCYWISARRAGPLPVLKCSIAACNG
jgi:hypothetical protein